MFITTLNLVLVLFGVCTAHINCQTLFICVLALSLDAKSRLFALMLRSARNQHLWTRFVLMGEALSQFTHPSIILIIKPPFSILLIPCKRWLPVLA